MFLKKSGSGFVFLAVITLLLGGAAAYVYKHPSLFFLTGKVNTKSVAACQGTPSKVSFKIHPSFYLNKKFLSKKRLSAPEEQAYIEKHLRYIFTSLPSLEQKSTPHFSVVPYGGFKVENIQQSDAAYPVALGLSWDQIQPRFLDQMKLRTDFESVYMKNAVAAGFVKKGEDALKISYEANLEVLLCEDENNHFSDQVTMPVDPFLAFWFVPQSVWIEKYNEVFKKNEKITACATDFFLYDHDPYYYWHYWSLDPKACIEGLVKGAFQTYPIENKKNISQEDPKPFDLKFLDRVRNRDLKMTVNFTLIDDDSVYKPAEFDEPLRATINNILLDKNFETAKSTIGGLAKYDIALQSGLIFAWSLKELSKDFKLEQQSLFGMLIKWRLRGSLKLSQQKYDITVMISSAMSDNPTYEPFYEVLNQGLAVSDIVYFGGHSGVGKNLSENRIHEKVANLYGTLPATEIPDHQLLVLMTCYSLHYFPSNGFPVPNKPFVRDVIHTASVPSGYDARILIGLMEQIDKYLASGEELALAKWPQYYDRDVFLYHQRTE